MWDATFEETLRSFLPFLSADEALTAETPLREYGLDSLAIVELLATLEQHYNVRFEDDALNLETFENPGRLWTTLSDLSPEGTPVS
ncbi:acyl carrier protein [Amycolatopsis cynarae]|uniref:Acyl carrier protein n=1 Tax=Amycolatopsis cynarae TaxID=2995223 RepID=A0ABY7B8D0_9PSEU|nr:acyl carrier protein [Amycolatopsis sp. HUAS 11-8]WAL67938.1 acyl carrier protein [Amycolatopsis sp. HUAS 11-8]